MNYYLIKYKQCRKNAVYLKLEHKVNLIQNLIVPENIKDELINNGVTGIKCMPVTLVNHDKHRILKKQWLITSCIEISGVDIRTTKYGIVRIRTPKFLLISEKVKQIFEQNNYKMYEYERIY